MVTMVVKNHFDDGKNGIYYGDDQNDCGSGDCIDNEDSGDVELRPVRHFPHFLID